MTKQALQEEMFDLIYKRSLTADAGERADLTERIYEIQDQLKEMN